MATERKKRIPFFDFSSEKTNLIHLKLIGEREQVRKDKSIKIRGSCKTVLYRFEGRSRRVKEE